MSSKTPKEDALKIAEAIVANKRTEPEVKEIAANVLKTKDTPSTKAQVKSSAKDVKVIKPYSSDNEGVKAHERLMNFVKEGLPASKTLKGAD